MKSKKLCVFWNDDFIGEIEKARRDIRFSYVPSWELPISQSMPCNDRGYQVVATNFFANLLPEGSLYADICKFHRITSIYDFLEIYGGDCAGALSVSSTLHPVSNTWKDITKDLSSLLRKPNMSLCAMGRLSLAGAQNKLAVKKEDDVYLLPLGNSPSTHIIKSASARYSDIHRNEMFCMDLAELCGFPVPEHDIMHIGEHEAYIIKRYDRICENDTIVRIHQEDFCQATGASRYEKYILGFWQCSKFLDAHDKNLFVHMAMFNFLIGNCDAHAKNFSLLYTPRPKLAPFYDLISTLVYPELVQKFAMPIGNTYYNDDIDMSSWERFCQELKVDMPHVPVMEYAEDLAREHRKRFGDMSFYDKILRIMESQTAKLASSPRMHACL